MAPLVSAIREPQGGGSQAFVSDLARGLARRGHEVHVYAATGSQIPGVTVIDTGVDPRSLAATLYRAGGPAGRDPAPAESAFARAYSAVRENRYDLIHNHAFDAPAISLAAGLDTPVVHTLHLPPDESIAAALRQAALRQAARGGRHPAVACVSVFQASIWRAVARVDAILPPYVPTRSVPWSDAAGDGVVFAGRLSPEKGAAEAIDIAQAAGTRIDIYGDVYDAEYAREQVDPRRDAPGVVVHGGVPRASMWAVLLTWFGIASVLMIPRIVPSRRWARSLHLVGVSAVAVLFTLVLLSAIVTHFIVVLSLRSFVGYVGVLLAAHLFSACQYVVSAYKYVAARVVQTGHIASGAVATAIVVAV